MVPRPNYKDVISSQGYDIFAGHAIWNYQELAQLMGQGSLFVATARDPVSHLLSAYHFYHFKKWTRTDNITHFLDSVLDAPQMKVRGFDVYWRRNQQLVEMGMPAEETLNLTKVEEKMKQVQCNFAETN